MKRWGLLIFVVMQSISLWSEEIPFTILSTGDLHSRFEPHGSPFHLGGMARLKTAMDRMEGQLQEDNISVLRLDAGDCTEGSIFFNLGGGIASYEMLNVLGYDAITVGNHDWYLGPDGLSRVLAQIPLNFSFLSANLNWRNIPGHPLREKIKSYEVFYWVGGSFLRKGENGFEPDETLDYFKVGVFGLSTNESAFSFLFNPVMIGNPLAQARKEVLKLRRDEKVDVVIMLSHLLDEDDLRIAQGLSSVDIIIGGHSHHKVIPRDGSPVVIERGKEDLNTNATWFVKQGEFGEFLGRLDIVFDTDREKIAWGKSRYTLHQIDDRYEEDETVHSLIQNYKDKLSEKYAKKCEMNEAGDTIFTDHIAQSDIDLFKSGSTESYYGNLVVNAIFEKAKPFGAQFAVNNSDFLAQNLYRGPIHSATLYDALPHIYDPVLDRSWTIWICEIDGAVLKKAIETVFVMGLFFDAAGIEIDYDPSQSSRKVMSVRYQGEEIVNDHRYKLAASRGIVDALIQIRSELPGMTFEDTHVEIWGALRDYVKAHSPLRAQDRDMRVSGRIRTAQPDLVVLSEEIVATPMIENSHKKLNMMISVHNLGYAGLLDSETLQAQTHPTEVRFYYDRTPDNVVDNISLFKPRRLLFDSLYRKWSPSLGDMGDGELPENLIEIRRAVVPPLQKDQKASLSIPWDVSELPSSRYPYTFYVLVNRATGMGFVTETGSQPDEFIRKFIRVEESMVDNNQAMAFIYL